MSTPHAATTGALTTTVTVPDHARALAARLAGLFEADQEIVVRLNDAHDRLAAVRQAGFDGGLETRISVLERGTPLSCHDRRSIRMS